MTDGESLSYRGLNRQANRLARLLRSRGVGPGTLVGLCAERSPAVVVAMLGILKAGGAYVPLDPGLPRRRLGILLRDTRSPVVLVAREFRDHLPAVEDPEPGPGEDSAPTPHRTLILEDLEEQT